MTYAGSTDKGMGDRTGLSSKLHSPHIISGECTHESLKTKGNLNNLMLQLLIFFLTRDTPQVWHPKPKFPYETFSFI